MRLRVPARLAQAIGSRPRVSAVIREPTSTVEWCLAALAVATAAPLRL